MYTKIYLSLYYHRMIFISNFFNKLTFSYMTLPNQYGDLLEMGIMIYNFILYKIYLLLFYSHNKSNNMGY